MALMLNPQLGQTKKKNPNQMMIDTLGSQGMHRFKSIFDNNNTDSIKGFFEDPFIRRLWPVIIELLSEDKILPDKKL